VKLHTDFHDYYDHAVGYGIDEKVHYNRFAKKVDIPIRPLADRPIHNRSGILGYCGSFYPFIEISRYDKMNDCDFQDDFDGRIIEKYYAFSLEEYRAKEKDWYEYSDDFGYFGEAGEIKLKQFFLDWKVNSDEVFLELKAPVWLKRFYSPSPDGVVNPCLKNLGFDCIRDSFGAFQDISMYLSNILIEQKATEAVIDKYRIEQHGFDLKESFRKTKKRR
jgi:hypothetical protein